MAKNEARLYEMAPTLLRLAEWLLVTMTENEEAVVEPYYTTKTAMFNCALETVSYIQAINPPASLRIPGGE